MFSSIDPGLHEATTLFQAVGRGEGLKVRKRSAQISASDNVSSSVKSVPERFASLSAVKRNLMHLAMDEINLGS